MSQHEYPRCDPPARNVDSFALSGTSAPIRYVKTRCPALIAALVAMAPAEREDEPAGLDASCTARASATRARG
jgi:hypothetical protein